MNSAQFRREMHAQFADATMSYTFLLVELYNNKPLLFFKNNSIFLIIII